MAHLAKAAGLTAHIGFAIATVLVLAPATAAELPGLAAKARSILGAGQGVYVESADGSILLSQSAEKAVHPASITKLPTTLALLRKLGPEYRFVTIFSAGGPVRNGTLDGDLLIESSGDPQFVDENALLVARRLNQLGIRRITGVLRPQGPFTFDWQEDNDAAHLLQAMSGTVPPAAWAAVRSLDPAAVSLPALQFGGTVPTLPGAAGSAGGNPLVIHRSQRLLSLVKDLNDYSNNILKSLAQAAGGPAMIESVARGSVPVEMRAEITLRDGAGTDAGNRLSPRAAVRLLRALEQELAITGHTLVDVLPVAGIDAGTLRDRLNGPGETGRVVGKTGTFDNYGASALIGAISTRDRGTVYFAILNHGVPSSMARRRQDLFVTALLAGLNSATWNYQRDTLPSIARAQAELAGIASH